MSQCSPKAKEATGRVSKDETMFDMVCPNVYSSQIENVLKKGMK